MLMEIGGDFVFICYNCKTKHFAVIRWL